MFLDFAAITTKGATMHTVRMTAPIMKATKEGNSVGELPEETRGAGVSIYFFDIMKLKEHYFFFSTPHRAQYKNVTTHFKGD